MIPPTKERLREIVGRFASQSVLVIGDVMLDQFIWGRVDRISPEAPVPVVEIVKESVHLGGAGNVACNLSVLGARPLLIGVVGQDEAGRRLIEELKREGIGSEGILQDEKRITSLKTRIIAHHQQVCRADRESREPISESVARRIRDLYQSFLEQAGAIVVSDYAKGVLSADLLQHCIQRSRTAGKFLAIDPKAGDFSVYQGASMITPNKKEAERASGLQVLDESSFLEMGRRLRELAALDYLLITRGEEGMTLFEDQRHTHIPAVAREVFDVTGAGDTVIATLALAVAAGASVWEAATLANHAAGIVVGKLGTASATAEEILASISG